MATKVNNNNQLQGAIMVSAICLLVIAILASKSITCRATTHYKTYESISRRTDDGNQVTSEKILIKLDSADPASEPKVMVDKTVTNSIGNDMLSLGGGRDNEIRASKFNPDQMWLRRPSNKQNNWFHKQNLIGGADYDTANVLNSIGGHQLMMRARTVESPALSVDTGRGRSGNPSVRIANGIKKLFNVENGHYTEMYDKIDKHRPLTKRKPTEVIGGQLGSNHAL